MVDDAEQGTSTSGREEDEGINPLDDCGVVCGAQIFALPALYRFREGFLQREHDVGLACSMPE